MVENLNIILLEKEYVHYRMRCYTSIFMYMLTIFLNPHTHLFSYFFLSVLISKLIMFDLLKWLTI